MVKVKWDAVRVAAMSLSVLVGGLLFLLGLTNLVLRLQGQPAPDRWAILAFIVLGAALFGVPTAIAMRDMLASRR